MSDGRHDVPRDTCKAVLLRLFTESKDPYAFMMLVIAVGQALSSLLPPYWDDAALLEENFLGTAVVTVLLKGGDLQNDSF